MQIVVLILAGISIMMLTGNNGILNKAGLASEKNRGGEVKDYVRLVATNNYVTNYASGSKKDRETVIAELHSEGKLTNEEVTALDEQDVITIGGVEIDFSLLPKTLTLVEMFKQAQADNCIGTNCTNETHLHIGDYVKYAPENTAASATVGQSETGYDAEQTYTIETGVQWRVLGLNEAGTQVLLTSESPLRKASHKASDGTVTTDDPYLVLQGAESYAYCKTTLDKICGIYMNTNLATEARSMTIEDVNRALGVTVEKNANGTPTAVYNTSDETKTNIDIYYGVESYTYKTGNFAPENYLGIGTKAVGDKVYRTSYLYEKDSLTTTNTIAKDLIFKGTTSNDKQVEKITGSETTWTDENFPVRETTGTFDTTKALK